VYISYIFCHLSSSAADRDEAEVIILMNIIIKKELRP